MTSIDLNKSLVDYLKEIPDHRDTHGRRHPLWLILLIMILGIMSGYWGYRGLGRFVERHRRQLIQVLNIPQARVPSYSTLRRVMIDLDYEAVTQVFNDWASQYPSYVRLRNQRVAETEFTHQEKRNKIDSLQQSIDENQVTKNGWERLPTKEQSSKK